MTTRVSGPIVRAAQRLCRGRTSNVILCYHRILEDSIDPWGLSVRPDYFEGQLITLRQYGYEIVPLTELIHKPAAGKLRAAITFDDGYADNGHTARDILVRHSAPATFFLTTSFIGSSAEFWWDEIERVLQTDFEPISLELRSRQGTTISWTPVNHRIRSTSPSWRCWKRQRAEQQRLYVRLYRFLHSLDEDDRKACLKDLRQRFNWGNICRDSRHAMTWTEVRELLSDGLFSIGAHTVHHVKLGLEDIYVQQREIHESRREIEARLSRSVTEFAYPFGSRDSYSLDSIRAIQTAGFSLACTTVPGSLRPGFNRYEVPRFSVHNWNCFEFALRLSLC